MNCPECGGPLVDMTVHGGPMNFVCTRGHRLADGLDVTSHSDTPFPLPPPEPPKFLDRAVSALKSVFSRHESSSPNCPRR